MRAWDRLVFRGSPESRRFLAFYLRDGILQAAFGLNRGGDPEDPDQDGELKACVRSVRGTMKHVSASRAHRARLARSGRAGRISDRRIASA